jgi:phosphocarrier protein FPr
MVAGLGADVLSITPGQQAVLDADSGELIVNPAGSDLAEASARQTVSAVEQARPALARTADGWPITVLCNVASAAETRRGLAAGASGVGLLRTEIPFGAALAWPTAAEHAAALEPILGLLAGRVATVRLLDFSGDKIPPFLRQNTTAPSGLAALLEHPTAASDQLRAAITAGRDTDLAILTPMVRSPGEVARVRELLTTIAADVGVAPPRLGIMVELAATAAAAERFTAGADFFSIGTNDLTGQVLGMDRLDPAVRPELAADPRVLRLIRHVVDVAGAVSTPVSVCGDSAADPIVLPLLVGLRVPAFSVPAARVGQVRGWISGLSMAACQHLAARAIAASTADDVAKLVRHAELS